MKWERAGGEAFCAFFCAVRNRGGLGREGCGLTTSLFS